MVPEQRAQQLLGGGFHRIDSVCCQQPCPSSFQAVCSSCRVDFFSMHLIGIVELGKSSMPHHLNVPQAKLRSGLDGRRGGPDEVERKVERRTRVTGNNGNPVQDSQGQSINWLEK